MKGSSHLAVYCAMKGSVGVIGIVFEHQRHWGFGLLLDIRVQLLSILVNYQTLKADIQGLIQMVGEYIWIRF